MIEITNATNANIIAGASRNVPSAPSETTNNFTSNSFTLSNFNASIITLMLIFFNWIMMPITDVVILVNNDKIEYTQPKGIPPTLAKANNLKLTTFSPLTASNELIVCSLFSNPVFPQ